MQSKLFKNLIFILFTSLFSFNLVDSNPNLSNDNCDLFLGNFWKGNPAVLPKRFNRVIQGSYELG